MIGGFGSHIKATREIITIQHKGKTTEISIAELDHLLIIGGHTIQTSAINTLLHAGVFISFFDSEGEPLGFIEPYGYKWRQQIQELREKTTPFSYALICAKSATFSRLLIIEEWNEQIPGGFLMSGELDILTRAVKELDNLIKIEEIRRIDRLVGDMYYEIMSRKIDPSLGFKRRTPRPYRDPVNTMLSLGYAMLNGACTQALIGVHCDPDDGFLNRGKRSLTQDLINCWKTRMVDETVIRILNNGIITSDMYECSETRCILAEALLAEIIPLFQQNIRQDIITMQVEQLARSLSGEEPFQIIRF